METWGCTRCAGAGRWNSPKMVVIFIRESLPKMPETFRFKNLIGFFFTNWCLELLWWYYTRWCNNCSYAISAVKRHLEGGFSLPLYAAWLDRVGVFPSFTGRVPFQSTRLARCGGSPRQGDRFRVAPRATNVGPRKMGNPYICIYMPYIAL